VLRDGAAGVLVPPAEPAALAAAIVDLLNDPVARERYAVTGEAAANRLSWVHVTDEILTAYEDARRLPPARGRPGFVRLDPRRRAR